jgi:hypothetical protein
VVVNDAVLFLIYNCLPGSLRLEPSNRSALGFALDGRHRFEDESWNLESIWYAL